MRDFEQESYKLGIPLRTRHNEVAPSQFECAPIFEETNHLDGIAYANSHLNWIYRQKKLVIALDYGFNVLNIRINQKKEREVQNAMYDIATTYHILGDNNKAKTFLYTSI